MNARPRIGLMSLALVAVLMLFSFVDIRQVQANSSVSVNIGVFHDALAPYGNWVNHRTYGQVWYPRNVARDWRPYTDGYWAHTPDYGWLWVSYEPWGWAPFHYGRWAWDNWYGWVWVPGQIWAPAWVFWRSGGGYAAWAPMPPNVVWQPNVGLNISYFNYDRDLRWDSWVAVREHNFSDRHLNRHINPARRNLQIINNTNYINNVTLINNNIVNQGIPIQQIEAVTGRRIEPVAPVVLEKVNGNTAGQPSIVRLPMAQPTQEEIHQNEELARRLDGKNPDGTRTEPPAANPARPGNQEPRVPGRLVGAPEPVQAPFVTQEQPNPLPAGSVEQALPLPAIPQTPTVGLGLDASAQLQTPEAALNPAPLVPVQAPDRPSSVAIQPLVPVSPQDDSASVPVPAADQQPVLTDAATLPPLQNQPQAVDPAQPAENQPLQYPRGEQAPIPQQVDGALAQVPIIDQQPVATDAAALSPPLQNQLPLVDSAKPADNLERQYPQGDQASIPQQIDGASAPIPVIDQQPVSIDAGVMPSPQNQQQMEQQQQQTERANLEAQQIQQQESARQQELQNQQQLELQQQQADRANLEAQQMQQHEAARQQELQNQQQVELQQQQAEHANQEAQQRQQQESARQQELQNQQQIELQQQQAERANQEAQQMQQQEAARQQKLQNQQQMEVQQQTKRARQEAQQQQEAALQQELQKQ